MQYSQLSTVRHRVNVGAPLPFNVRDADATLLLARGRVVESFDQMEALFARGALVDIAELRTPAEQARLAAPKELPRLWRQSFEQVGRTLLSTDGEAFRDALDDASAPVLALIERDSDLAIFQVLSHDANAYTRYGVDHSVHAAITAYLVAQRLGWNADDTLRAFKAALTMNVSMLELQGQLAAQDGPITAEQKDAVQAHPQWSAQMLELSGITDRDWLEAVLTHHEQSDGGGYPAGRRDIGDLAELLQRADRYTAKLSSRHGRHAIDADRAARMMFMQEPGHPMVAALVKEFGVYPPGCFVRLVSGEIGVVVKRGPSVTTPVVAVLTSPSGTPLGAPVRRDTLKGAFAVQAVLGADDPRPALEPAELVALTLDGAA